MTAAPHSPAVGPDSPLTPVMRALENTGALDPVVAVGDAVARIAAGNDRVRGVLQGRKLGHAVHPLLVEVPMGTWLSALLLDVLGGPGERGAARMLTGVGVLSAVPSALTGWAEYSGAQRRDRRVAVVHAAANGLATGLQAGSWVARHVGRDGLGRALGLSGMGVAGLGGYLGGHLAIARTVGTRDVVYTRDRAQTGRVTPAR
ncbi:DUF2231 domain-containing protein [Dermacoccus nishinomiyaensis]|uniref:DUF2231 domain-containing protein n=1 Tax=Dermacoccus nishinomiyaensis TaxID=1274 RepID=UPI0013F410A8|nr:DUF2231 domain-containing protein [Dermacoccus nishinomiyaensis]MCG7429211.1 hypothetical protein [Dermacoccus nishinomiyaensis]NHC32781.1 hypothetical protein [Dermacoccus nishinomiyaensis]